MLPQRVEMRRAHLSGRQRELDGVITQSLIRTAQIRLSIIEHQLFGELRVP